MELFDSLIIGAGPAGSSAAIFSAETGNRVLLLDKSRFPRDKVCGEFLSPAIWSFLKKLGLHSKILETGTRVDSATFVIGNEKSIRLRLPVLDPELPFGWGISRRSFDALLLSEARYRGVTVLENMEVTHYRKEKSFFTLQATEKTTGKLNEFRASRLIHAAGRESRWKHLKGTTHKTGFKAHFTGPALEHSVRLYFFKKGYVGLVEVENGETNVCGIASNECVSAVKGNFDELMKEIAEENGEFKAWLAAALRKSSWLTCSRFDYGFNQNTLPAVGDAASFVEPFLGQGITLALASAFQLCGRPHNLRNTSKIKRLYKQKARLRPLISLALNSAYSMPWLFRLHTRWPAVCQHFVRKACSL